MKISQREMVLAIATLAAVLGGLTWYVVDNKAQEWKTKANEMAKIEQQISLHQNAIKMQDNWMDELNGLQQDLRIFPPEQKSVAPDLSKTIKGISSTHGLDITRTQPYNEKQIDDLYEIGINCTWEGTLESLVHFLTEIQQQGVRYDVRQLNVTPVGKNTGRLKGNMVVHCVYTRRAETPPPKN